ncbi:zinc-binding alcohol dehydrogenase (plasmid) [Mesorhizobium loti]|uniref:alcohol dehydrogenase n=1 Tax=Mesorhizobium jarvisii TaxID=1777867 RepID=A0A6M7TRL7_9HYPH|nr:MULTISPECIES: alcohol dehydrogenase catalytic domain-containing protein [Mesorhizobium]OBQ69624.1 zinc-binding alcohol dehydrogenase [Mesorhizobium loti]QKC67505.1 zinc-binding alcohol dehydrogenase [Mesorhizobium jarvisii]QKD13419.1 zinc-binding alcohol dehydrogenase [Mesorhizobium loti]RJT29529.1 zinc-binding alcohol dehydrogenase [Mesorhizobium jarvisii]
MSHSMLAAVLEMPGEPLRIMNVPRPEPGRGEILVRLEASGICHTDVHVWQGHLRPASGQLPTVLGHEGVGRVVQLGTGVTGWRLGERAGVAWLHDTCGACDECHFEMESFCQHQRAHGFDVAGTFAEYVVADARFAARVPEEGDAALLAPLMCAGLTAFGAVQRAGVKAGEVCAVFGCGGLGLYAIQIARRLGATVVAVDTDEAKLQLAASYGAEHTLLSPPSLADSWPANLRAHVCINFAPTPATWGAMIAAIRPRGRIVAAAMVSQTVPLSQEWLTASGVWITGTSVGTRAQMQELMQLHHTQPLETQIERVALAEVSSALDRLKAGNAGGRLAIVFDTRLP